MISTDFVRRTKMAALTTLLAGGMLLGSGCSWVDVRHNVIAGTQSFVKGYTTSLWDALIPPPEELIAWGEE
ncbi:MAG: hypothetical protein WBE26_14005 [Phycisphaerae bacterium]